MHARIHIIFTLVIVTAVVHGPFARAAARQTPDDSIAVRRATVDGLTLQYLEAGQGSTVVLLHGYAETSRMWRPRGAPDIVVVRRSGQVAPGVGADR